jgi:aminodeoxychorismate lyase
MQPGRLLTIPAQPEGTPMQELISINGRIMPAAHAQVGAQDRGLLYGDGVFETMRAVDGWIVDLDEHLARLKSGAGVLRIPVPSITVLKRALNKTIQKSGLDCAYVRLTLTRGAGGNRLAVDTPLKPTIIITVKEYHPYPAVKYRQGFVVKILSTRRNSTSPLSRIKSLNYLDNILGKMEASAVRADEGLFLNEKGHVACGTVSNIFFIKGRILHTPPLNAGVLPGITRRRVMKNIAPALGLRVVEKNIAVNELRQFAGVFVTNTLMGVMPVSKIGSVKYRVDGVVEQIRDYIL